MRKVGIFFVIGAICAAVAVRYFHPDFSWFTDASSDQSGPIADMNQPLPKTVVI